MEISNINNKRKAFFSFLAGSIFSFCYIAGYSLDRFDSLDIMEVSFYGKWLFGAVGFALLFYGILQGLPRIEKYLEGKRYRIQVGKWLSVPVCMVMMIICWFPALLSLFPGAFSYDALDEWQQVKDWILTSHHPVLHVLVLGGLVEGFHTLTGSYNAGIAVYTIVQMLLLSWLLSLSIRRMKELGLRQGVCIFALAFFCLSPVIQLFSICATKDVIFSAAELLFLQEVLFFYCRREEFLASRHRQICLVLSAIFTMILRNNGVYIILGMLVFMGVSCRKYWKKALLLLVGILLPYFLYTGIGYRVLHVEPGGVEEMLSVPLQQMARVYHYDQKSLAREDVELLLSMVPQESLEHYRATVSDFVKADFRGEVYQTNKSAFWKLWVKWGREHPLTYLNSFLINTVDFWYPHAVIDGYRDAFGKSSYFDYQVDLPGTEVVLLPGAHAYYEKISHDMEAQSGLFAFLFLSPGTYLLFFLGLFFYLWCYRRYLLLLPLLMVMLHFGTVLLGPVALVRYVLILFYAFPLFVGILLEGSFITDRK